MRVLIICSIFLANLWAISNGVVAHDAKISLASIVKIEGKVKILSASSIKKRKAVLGESLFAGDKLISYADAKVLVKLEDCSKVILDESSELTFVDIKNLRQEKGEVYYKIEKRASSKGLRVETPFSIIGIKGTEFIVNSTQEGEIALNEGLIGVESLHAAFELHKAKVMAEYEAYKNKQLIEFEAYKSQAKDEVVSYVKEFDLHASKVLRFAQASNCEKDCESRVNEEDFTDEIAQRFASYQSIIQE